jgi:hypothetical protein
VFGPRPVTFTETFVGVVPEPASAGAVCESYVVVLPYLKK